jgi:amidase
MPIASDIRLHIEALVADMEQRGVQGEHALPAIDWTQQAQLAARLFALVATTFENHSAGTPPSSLEDYFLALQQRDGFIVAWEEFFTRWDALICPVGPITAPQHDETITQVEGAALPETLHDIPYAISPVFGCPSVILPLARDRHGLPIGVQVLGRRWDDECLLAIAEVLSQVTGGFQRPPGY